MKTNILKTVALVAVACSAMFGLSWAGFRNVEITKAAAPQVWAAAGYKIVGYEGYQWAPVHGSSVWYLVRRVDDNGITYHGALSKWGKEYHIYNLSALDALKPQ